MPPIVPTHFLNLTNATTLKTEAFALTQRAVDDCIARSAMGAIYGPAGNGKTFAVRTALASISDRPVVYMDCQEGMTYKGLIVALLEAVTGGLLHTGTRPQLERTLMRELRDEPRIICVDEAQRLKAEGIEILRSLHDDPDTQLTLLLVGGNNCWNVLSSQPMLRSRLHRAVEFRRLTEATALKLMPKFHPLLRDCQEAVLRLVDRSFGKGSLRNWANFVASAESICQAAGEPTVTELVARNAFTLLGARPVASS